MTDAVVFCGAFALQVYRLYSESITQAIVTGGPHTARSSFVKYMRSVKKAVLRLVEVFVEKCEDDALLITQFVPALIEPVLGDYAASVPDARYVLGHLSKFHTGGTGTSAGHLKLQPCRQVRGTVGAGHVHYKSLVGAGCHAGTRRC
jgi:hypothetical protein